MANLASYQKLTRVTTSPWGTGADGAYSSATIPTLTKDSCSGSATSTTLTTAGSTFANGDILLIHQTRGTGVGQWEINKVDSGGGSTSLTLNKALNYTYTDSGASQAQAIKIPQYTNVTVESGTWTVPNWDGNTGGILTFACNGDLTVTGTISGNSAGFIGSSSTVSGSCGEGTANAASNYGAGPNGNGGGGANGGGGGGGGNGAAGSVGGTPGGAYWAGNGGSAVGSADLLLIDLGGGGGTGNAGAGNGLGGDGAGMVVIFAKNVASINSITLNGDNGGSGGAGRGGGGGAGGSCLIECNTATLGTNKITVAAGAGGYGAENYGGAGAVGRIAVHHSGTVTGTTSPSFEDVTDATLKEASGGSFIFNMI